MSSMDNINPKQDSKAQIEHERENEAAEAEARHRSASPAGGMDRRLDGPNRPAT